jgi:hypothetical protein
MSISQKIKDSIAAATPPMKEPAVVIAKYDFDALALELGILGDDLTKEDAQKMSDAVGARVARFQMPARGWFVCENEIMLGFVEMVAAASQYQQIMDRAHMMEIQRRQTSSGLIMPEA